MKNTSRKPVLRTVISIFVEKEALPFNKSFAIMEWHFYNALTPSRRVPSAGVIKPNFIEGASPAKTLLSEIITNHPDLNEP